MCIRDRKILGTHGEAAQAEAEILGRVDGIADGEAADGDGDVRFPGGVHHLSLIHISFSFRAPQRTPTFLQVWLLL